MAENILKIRNDKCVVLNSLGDGFEIREGNSLSWLNSGKSPSKMDLSFNQSIFHFSLEQGSRIH